MEFGLILIVALLALLAYLGWGKGHRWARITFIASMAVIICAAIAIALFIQALGQTNWSH